MDREELNVILENHKRWLNDEEGKRANLQDASLRRANLWDANLQDANLWGTNLWGANLQNADLREANLWGTNLRRANLWDANLQDADLQDANLWRANLQGANINKANLKNANIDYSCWPLWCGSLGVIVDAKIARQLMYHALSVLCEDPEFLTIRNNPDVLAFANKFHRVEMRNCPELKPIEQEEGNEI